LLPSLTSFLPVPRPCRGTWWIPSACSSASRNSVGRRDKAWDRTEPELWIPWTSEWLLLFCYYFYNMSYTGPRNAMETKDLGWAVLPSRRTATMNTTPTGSEWCWRIVFVQILW